MKILIVKYLLLIMSSLLFNAFMNLNHINWNLQNFLLYVSALVLFGVSVNIKY